MPPSARPRPAERDAYAMATKAPYLAPQPVSRWSVWGAAYGGSATTDGNAVVGSHDTTARAYGVVGGADYKVTPDALIGFALAGGGTNFSVASALGTGRSDLFQAGVFGRQNIGAAYLSGGARLWLAGCHHQPHRGACRHRRAAGALPGRDLLGTFRGRLPLRDAARRHHALCRSAGDQLQSAGLCRAGAGRHRHLRAELRRADHHRDPHRTRASHRQILRGAGRHLHAARPRRLGA